MVKALLSRLSDTFFSGDTSAEINEGKKKRQAATPASSQDTADLPTPVKARQTKNQRSDKTFFQWTRERSPTCQAMILDDLKLVYQPIAKNACSSTKRLVAELGGLQLAKGQCIHQTLDSQNTGLQFKDRSHDDVTAALIAPDWMRFIIYREPLDRIVSAYVEKFVLHRNRPNQWKTKREVLQAIFDKEDPTPEDYEYGITFREFAEYILAENPDNLNGHWRPQTSYMGNIPFTHMYDVKALNRLEADLQQHVGADVSLPRANVSRGKQSEPEYMRIAPDLLPRDLGNAANLSVDSFLDGDLRARLTEYYAADITVYRLVQSVNGPVTRHQ